MFSITVTVSNASELVRIAQVLEGAGVAVGVGSSPEEAVAKTTKASTAKASVKKEQATTAPVEQAAPKELSAEEKEKLYAPVKEIALKLSKEKGREVLLRVLGAFNVEKAPELTVEQYDDFKKLAEEELLV